jgi:hypothetical protein
LEKQCRKKKKRNNNKKKEKDYKQMKLKQRVEARERKKAKQQQALPILNYQRANNRYLQYQNWDRKLVPPPLSISVQLTRF